MTTPSASGLTDATLKNFERILSLEPFTGLKAILDSLTRDRDALCGAVITANSYEQLLNKLGYRIALTKQIHVQDAFSRLGPAGGIRAVLPYFNIPAQSALPTLIHFDSSVSMTSDSVTFFNNMLSALRLQMSAENPQPV